MNYVGTNRSPVTVILLSLVTCGIYGLWWMYTIGNEINTALGKDAVNPIFGVLAIIPCVGTIIMLYYIYTVDQALQELCPSRGVPYSSNAVLWIIVSIFISYFVFEAMAQSTLNQVWDASQPQG